MTTQTENAQTITMDDLAKLFVTDEFGLAEIAPTTPRHIAMLVYPGMFALDMVGPLSVLQGLMNRKIHHLWKTTNPVNGGSIQIMPSGTFEDCPDELEVLLIPGGSHGTLAAMRDPAVIDFVQQAASRAKYVTSVCTGSLILGVAGLLKGKRATTHWSAMEVLSNFGATAVQERYVVDDNVITAAGVSAGIDFALALAAKIAGERYARSLQLDIEYDPAPPFAAGSVDSADPDILAGMRAMYQPLMEEMGRLGIK